jgi:hypothetical protein
MMNPKKKKRSLRKLETFLLLPKLVLVVDGEIRV